MSALLGRVVDVLHASAALQTATGRNVFAWINEAPPGEPLPVLVIEPAPASVEARAAKGTLRSAEQGFAVAAHSTSRATAASLSRVCGSVITAGALAGSLAALLGTAIDCRPTGEESDSFTSDPSSTGADVWARRVTYSAMVPR